MTRRDGLEASTSPAVAPARVRGVALAALLATLNPSRRDLAFRVYVVLRRRELSRTLSADLAGRACAAADAGADLASIAAELRIPVGHLSTAAPADACDARLEPASLDAAGREVAPARRAAEERDARGPRAAHAGAVGGQP